MDINTLMEYKFVKNAFGNTSYSKYTFSFSLLINFLNTHFRHEIPAKLMVLSTHLILREGLYNTEMKEMNHESILFKIKSLKRIQEP